MSTKSRRGNLSGTGVSVPVTPMLDMTFQLLFFFVSTFNYTPVEGQISMKLSSELSEPRGPIIIAIPNAEKDPVRIIVHSTDGNPTNFEVDTLAFAKDSIPNLKELLKVLDLFLVKSKVKVTLEVQDNLSYAKLIAIMDALRKAGFDEIGVSGMSKAKT